MSIETVCTVATFLVCGGVGGSCLVGAGVTAALVRGDFAKGFVLGAVGVLAAWGAITIAASGALP